MSKYFKCNLNKPALSYNCGEIIRFEISARDNCCEIPCKYIRWELKGDDGKYETGLGSCDIGKPLIIETKLDRAGFVYLICKSINGDDNQPMSDFDVLEAGAGAEVEKIKYHDKLPEDFCEYWKDVRDLIAKMPLEVQKFEEISAIDGFKAYDVRIKSPEGRPASFTLSVPDKPGKFPLKTYFIGYSLCGAITLYNDDTITAYFNAHGIENNVPRIELIEKYGKEIGEDYGFSNAENKSNLKTYWRDVIIRDLIGVKFLKTLENWDGETFIIEGGSQGAFQSATVAANTDGVTYLCLNVPWFCDLRAVEQGFMSGWRPDFAEGLRYFDTVAQGNFIKCPVKITAGLGDYICPPSGVMALYNNIKTLKTIEFIQSKTHSYNPPEKETFVLNFDPENPSGEVQKGKYRHFKGGEYEVITLALNSENTEETVVYRSLNNDGKVWVRPKSEFCGFVFRNKKIRKRFELLN